MRKPNVAFICVHNSCRSQIAEALGKKLAGDAFESYSAGTETKPQINQDAVRIMKEIYDIDMEKEQYSKLLADIPEPDTKEIRDTVASLRLDSIIASGFRIGRSLAAQHIHAGKAAIDGLPCEKPDKLISEGMKISVRGLGKIKLYSISGRTKKDRISVVIHRYV